MKIEISCAGYSYTGETSHINIPVGEGDWVWRILPSSEKPDKVVIYEDDNQGWGYSYGIYFLDKKEKTVAALHIGEGGNPDARGILAKIIGEELATLWLTTDMAKILNRIQTLPGEGAWIVID